MSNTLADNLTCPNYRAKFWDRADKSSGEEGCWLWTDGRDGDGYGLALFNGHRIRASRIALMLTVGELAPGEIARHKCDNPPCCNPLHLERGTHLDNAADRDQRGRNGKAKLTPADVLRIRELRAANYSNNAVARMMGIGTATASRAATGKAWRWVSESAYRQSELGAYGKPEAKRK